MPKTPTIDLVPEHSAEKIPAGRTRTQHPSLAHILGRVFIAVCATVLVASALLVYKVVSVAGQSTAGSNTSLLSQLAHLVTSKDKPIRGEEDDRINVLLLGIGGPGHQGAYLADTIIVASLDPKSHDAAFLSVPRDLYVPIPGLGTRKINNANAFGRESNYPGGGERLTAEVVSQTLGIPIHYYARVDFAGFEQLIETINGIDVTVDRSFVDREYPTSDFGYQTISFAAGRQRMDGTTALRYVRSRHGSNGEGSDFARSKRQQKVILAIKEKVLSAGTLLNPKRISELLSAVGAHTRTNMELQEIVRLAQLAQSVDTDRIITEVLDTGPGGLLVSATTPDGAYILLPRDGDFGPIRQLAKNIFAHGLIARERATISIENGTTERGLAEDVAKQLEGLRFQVVAVGNADRRDYRETVIYDLTGGQKPYTRDALRDRFRARVVNNLPLLLDTTGGTSLRQNLNATRETQAQPTVDLLIVLGADQTNADRSLISSSTLSAAAS